MELRALTSVTLAALAVAATTLALRTRGTEERPPSTSQRAAGGDEPPAQASTQGPTADSRTQDPQALGPRARVAGIDSLRVTSRVRFTRPESVPHSLEVSFAFPARARLALRPEGARTGQRVLRYARGGDVYGFGQSEATSTRFEGAAAIDERLSIEARRAAFVWPEAHAWSGDGAERRAALAGLGTLVVELALSDVASPTDADGTAAEPELRPRRVRALRADGSEVEALDVIRWRRFEAREGARAWPFALRLSVAEEVVWEEEVLHVERPAPWIEDWFVPPDRRAPRDAAVAGLRAIDLSCAIVRDIAVPLVDGEVSSIEAALAFAKRVADDARARGHALDARVTLVVSPAFEPRAVRLVLADEAAPIPEGWRLEPAQPAWLVFFDSVDAVGRRAVDELLRAAPSAQRTTDLALLLVVTDAPRGGVQLVLIDPPR